MENLNPKYNLPFANTRIRVVLVGEQVFDGYVSHQGRWFVFTRDGNIVEVDDSRVRGWYS